MKLLFKDTKNVSLRYKYQRSIIRNSYTVMFLGIGVLKIYSKFIGEQPSRSAISIKWLYQFIEITLRHGCSPVTLLHIFRTPFPKNTSDRLLLYNGVQSYKVTASSFLKKCSPLQNFALKLIEIGNCNFFNNLL